MYFFKCKKDSEPLMQQHNTLDNQKTEKPR